MFDALPMWTIYDHPADYPYDFVARKWLAQGAAVVATGETIVAPTLDQLRGTFRDMGLTSLPRFEGDEPQIVEVWL